MVEFTEEQLKLLVPLVKIELGKKAQDSVNYMIARNRYTDLLDTIEDKEYYKDEVQLHQDKIEMYTDMIKYNETEMQILEQIIKQLNSDQ